MTFDRPRCAPTSASLAAEIIIPVTSGSSGRRRVQPPVLDGTLTLDASELLRRGVLAPGSRTRGVVSWHGPAGDTIASVSYEADMTRAGGGRLRLRFSTLDPHGGGRRQVDQWVALAATRPGFGGERWWFVDEGRRGGQLCLPLGAISLDRGVTLPPLHGENVGLSAAHHPHCSGKLLGRPIGCCRSEADM